MHPWLPRLRRALFCLLLGSQALLCEADEPPLALTEQGFKLSGFATLAVARSDSAKSGYVRDLSQPSGVGDRWTGKLDTLAGLQGNWQLSQQLEAVGQIISRYHGSGNYDPELMWAFLRYDPVSELSLRAGRLGTDFYLFSDSRNVGYANIALRPPSDYFGVLPFSHIDGGDLQYTLPLGNHLLRLKAFAGRLDEQYAYGTADWSLTNAHMKGISVTAMRGPWTVRLGHSELTHANNLPLAPQSMALLRNTPSPNGRALADSFGLTGTTSSFDTLGAVYDQGPLQAQLMLSRARHHTASFQNWVAGYGQVAYRIGEFTPYLIHSRIHSAPHSLTSGLPALDRAAGLSAISNYFHSEQHTNSIGLRWDFRTNTALKIQYDQLRASPNSGFPAREETGWNGRANILGIGLDFVF